MIKSLVKAIYDFKGDNDDELSFNENDHLFILNDDDDQFSIVCFSIFGLASYVYFILGGGQLS